MGGRPTHPLIGGDAACRLRVVLFAVAVLVSPDGVAAQVNANAGETIETPAPVTPANEKLRLGQPSTPAGATDRVSVIPKNPGDAGPMTDRELRLIQKLTTPASPKGISQAVPSTPSVDDAAPAGGDRAKDSEPVLMSPNERLPLGRRRKVDLNVDGADESAEGMGLATGQGWLMQTLGAMAIVIVLIFALKFVATRWTRRSLGGGASVVEVLTRVTVAPRSSVVLLRLGERVLVVGDGPGGMRTLAEVDDPDEVADVLAAVTAAQPGSVTQSFRQLFDRFGGDYTQPADLDEEGADGGEQHTDRTRDKISGLLGKVRALGGRGANA